MPREISKYSNTMEQLAFRKQAVLDFLEKSNVTVESLKAVVGRGGTLPMEGGVYEWTMTSLNALVEYDEGHASSLGGIIVRR